MIKELVIPERVVMINQWPGLEPSLITFEFIGLGGQTEVRLTHDGIPTSGMTPMFEGNWAKTARSARGTAKDAARTFGIYVPFCSLLQGAILMKELRPYLIFPGNCHEAMEFYKDCLNGEIVLMQTYAESPMAGSGQLPAEANERIFNSELRAEEICIMASDNMPGGENMPGSNFSLLTHFSERAELADVFTKLSAGGNVMMPLSDAPSGGKFGMLADKYGIQWMLAAD